MHRIDFSSVWLTYERLQHMKNVLPTIGLSTPHQTQYTTANVAPAIYSTYIKSTWLHPLLIPVPTTQTCQLLHKEVSEAFHDSLPYCQLGKAGIENQALHMCLICFRRMSHICAWHTSCGLAQWYVQFGSADSMQSKRHQVYVKKKIANQETQTIVSTNDPKTQHNYLPVWTLHVLNYCISPATNLQAVSFAAAHCMSLVDKAVSVQVSTYVTCNNHVELTFLLTTCPYI